MLVLNEITPNAETLELVGKICIPIAVAIFFYYIYLVTNALFTLFKYKKTLRAAELSIKMAIVEEITLIRNLCKIADIQLTMEEDDQLETIEGAVVNEEIFGLYSKANQLYLAKYNEAKAKPLSEENSKELEINFILENETDLLYQKALFTYNNDVIAYNYIVKFPFTKPFTAMLRFKKKEELY